MVVGDPRIIVALDYSDPHTAASLVARLDPGLCRLKIGSELFTRAGPEWVAARMAQGFDVFLDLKYHDIPRTVGAACRAAAELGVWMVDVHALGGRRMLEAARAGMDAVPASSTYLIAVTVLTSLIQDDLAEVGIAEEPAALADRMAALAATTGCDGVVCSASEAPRVRRVHGDDFVIVTPGIRPRGAQRGDQRRTLEPEEAVAAGADYLVIGRPVTQAADPVTELAAIERRLASNVL